MNLAEILNIKYPIIQGGMARISRGKLAAAVSNAGGLGIVGTGGLTFDEYVDELKIADSLIESGKIYGANVVLIEKDIEKKIGVILERKIPFITISAGNPLKYIRLFKDNGAIVYPLVGNSKMAKKCEENGADGVILEGLEGGGHLGNSTTMGSLLPTVKAVNIPVISAGGYGDGAQILAAEIMGAAGVQMGTRFLAAEETQIHPNFKEAICKAHEYETDITGTRAGEPLRQLSNPMTRKSLELEKQNASEEEFHKLYHNSLSKAVYEGNLEEGSFMAGISVGLVEKQQTVAEIFEELKDEYVMAKAKLSSDKAFF